MDEGPGLTEEKRLTREGGGGGEESYKRQGRGERRIRFGDVLPNDMWLRKMVKEETIP